MDGETPDAPASTAQQTKGSAWPLPGKLANALNATPVMPYVTSPATTPIKAGRNGKASPGKGEIVAADSPPISPLQKAPLSGLGFALDPPVTPAPSSRPPLGSPWLKPASGVELLAALQSDAGVLIGGMPQPKVGRLPLSQLQLPIVDAEFEQPPLDRQASTRTSGAGGLTPAAALAAAPPTSRELRNSNSFAALRASRSESLGASADPLFTAGLRVSGAGAGLLVSPKGGEGGGAAASPTKDSTGGLMVSPGGDRSFSGAGITGIEARRMHRKRSVSQAAQATQDTRPESSQGAQPWVGEQPPGRSSSSRLAPARSGVAPAFELDAFLPTVDEADSPFATKSVSPFAAFAGNDSADQAGGNADGNSNGGFSPNSTTEAVRSRVHALSPVASSTLAPSRSAPRRTLPSLDIGAASTSTRVQEPLMSASGSLPTPTLPLPPSQRQGSP